MPELAMDAPSFENIGARRSAAWMAAWINNPRSLRASAHMPRLFHADSGIAPEARDIAAYLSGLAVPSAPVAPESGSAEAGGRLFANLNCIGCHISPEHNGEVSDPADAGRIPLAFVKAKFLPGALKQFLLKPSAHYVWISMPNFRLSEKEAGNLAAYLLSVEGKPVEPLVAGDARNGEKLIHASGCLNCHVLNSSQKPQLSIPLAAIAKDAWARGCMAGDPASRTSAPDFSLTEAQRSSLVALAATGFESLSSASPVEFAERQIVSLRCTACHSRDGRESLLATDLAADSKELLAKYPTPQVGTGEGIAPDQRAPMLTWAGEKLRPEWMAKFIAGEIPYKPRYYLRARMPGFGVRAELLADGLAQEHGCKSTYPAYPPADKKLAEIGQGLVGKTPNQSFACVQCHAINQQAALAPFEAPAINFMYVTSRLREDYYYRWLHNPLAVDPETKMPRFDDADGKTGVPLFDNDAHKQFEAIWNYMLLGKDIAPPAQ
jgi:mono/diheme cytochrome c family protein